MKSNHSPKWGPNNRRRRKYAFAFGISTAKLYRTLTDGLMDQLDGCKSNAARRLILGVSK
jgi:hypothetical protein